MLRRQLLFLLGCLAGLFGGISALLLLKENIFLGLEVDLLVLQR